MTNEGDDYPPPPTDAWRRFLDEVAKAAGALAAGIPVPAPFERLTPAQFAVGKIAAATHELLRAMTYDRKVDDLAKLPAQAWQRASWGLPDPLLAVPRVAHSPGADPVQTMFRAAIVKLIAEATADGMSLRAATQMVGDKLRAQQAPQVPDERTMESWHRQATQQPGSHLAVQYEWLRQRPWPPSAGTTLAERVRWIIPAAGL